MSSIVERIFTSALGDIQLSCMPDLCLCLWSLLSPQRTNSAPSIVFEIDTLKYLAVLVRTVPPGSRQL